MAKQSQGFAPVQQKIGHAVVKNAPKKQKATAELENVLSGTHDVLVTASTVFPLTLFPDNVAVDRSKISITKRHFFWAGEIMSIALDDVLNVTATVGPFFGKVKITSRFFNPDKPFTVDNFWREDALKIARIIQGYMIAKQNEVDISLFTNKELAKKLDELGQSEREP
jgi:hypothetical protein